MSQERSLSDKPKGVAWGWIIIGLVVVVIVSALYLRNSEGTVQYYMTVSEYLQDQPKYLGKKIKIAGHVKAGSLEHQDRRYQFTVEDLGKEVLVTYDGIVPDTFKEGIEVVVEGRGQSDNHFEAKDLLAKCASKYQENGMPPLESMRGKSIR